MTIKLRFFYRQQFLQAVLILLSLIVLINFTSRASVAQEKTTSNKNSMSEISTVLITGLLALFGTVIGGVVKGYWDVTLADKDLQSKLILRALEPTELDERVNSLEFLITTNLITDSKIQKGIRSALDSENRNKIPRFKPVDSFTLPPGVSFVPSAKASIIENNPGLKEKTVALVALKVRHGGAIDSITPIFAEITPNLEIGNKIVGEQIGGEGGGETLLEKEGHIITAIRIEKEDYHGRDEVIHLQAIWQKLTPQGIDSAEVESEKLGTSESADISKPPKKKLVAVEPGNYISDFQSKLSYHTSGETFLNDIEIEQKKLPIGSMRA